MNYSDIKNIRKYDWFELSNYEPHPGQRLIHDSNARFRLVSAGRRWGKSLSAAREAECFLLKPNTRGWIVSKTYDLGEKVFREIYRNMIVRFRLQPRKKSNSVKSGNMFLEFPWDSVVEVKSESNPESLLGEGLDWLIFDECAGADRKTWEMYLRPTLSDKQGKAIFISCVTKDTMILGIQGLEEIGVSKNGYTSELKNIYGLNGFHIADQRYGSGLCPTKTITTKKGYKITCTPNHKLWTVEGWKRSDSFVIGDQLLLQYDQQVFGNNTEVDSFRYNKRNSYHNQSVALDKDMCYFLGLVLGNGSWTWFSVDISSKDKGIKEFLSNFRFKFNTNADYANESSNRCCSCKLSQFIDYMGIPHGANNKILSEKVLQLPKHLLVEVLRGYFDCDGYSRSNRHGVGIDSSSEKIIDQLHVLLLNFGIVSTKSVNIAGPTKKVNFISTIYRLFIDNGYAVSKFFSEIGFRLKRKQKNSWYQEQNVYKTSFRYDDFVNLFPSQYKNQTRIEIDSLKKIIDKKVSGEYSYDMICDEIISIEDSENYVYDFVIPDTHSYFSNGFISHNTPRGASNWFYEFYRRGLNQEVYPDWFSISSPTWDNPYIPAKEIEDARQTLSKPTFDQEYGAMFTVPSGLVYEEFSETVHVVPSSEIKIDKNCKFYKWIDFGYADPFVVLYVMETGDNRLFIFDEIYERRKSTDQIADMIYAKDDELYWKYDIKQSYKEDNEWINVADPSGASCRASLRDRKIYTVIPKKKDIKEQIELVRQELKLRDDGKPSLFVSKKCVETIREFISYAYTEDGGDKPIDDNNHTLDPSSYGLRVIRKGYIHQGIGVY